MKGGMGRSDRMPLKGGHKGKPALKMSGVLEILI